MTSSPDLTSSTTDPLDLIIVGAGISAVDLAHHVHTNFPTWRWRVFDSNADIGGTWETFKYPGIRSDSDMGTFCLPFAPWPHQNTLGEGGDIKEYLRDQARKSTMLERLQLQSWVGAVNYHSDKNLWEVTVHQRTEDGEDNSEGRALASQKTETTTHWTRRLHFASGYYRHGEGYTANIPGLDNFEGTLIHPQIWPEDLDVANKNVVIIGSGATAVTLLPALQNRGAHTTMLQRTPTYIAPLFDFDTTTEVLKKIMPHDRAFAYARKVQILRDMFQYRFVQKFPRLGRAFFWSLNRRFVDAKTIREHFTPPYDPWDQRVCKSPGGDFFKAMKDGAQVVTAHIDQVQSDGVLLQNGQFLPADILVTATGLDLAVFGEAEIAIDGQVQEAPDMVAYRGMMMNGLPNFTTTLGYLNASWTLRADLISRYLVHMWQMMDDKGYTVATPELPTGVSADEPLMNWSSSYMKRSESILPKQADVDPWIYEQDYIVERRRFLGRDQLKDIVFS